MKPRKLARIITAYLELPPDGGLKSMRIYVKSSDGKDLTYQHVLDAVSDCLIDDMCFTLQDAEEPALSEKWDA